MYHISDALCHWQVISPLVARGEVNLMKANREKLWKVTQHYSWFSKFTRNKQKKSTGSEAAKIGKFSEDISDILLRQVITSWNRWRLAWQDLTRIGPWNGKLIGEFHLPIAKPANPSCCQWQLSVACGELKRPKVNISWTADANMSASLWLPVCARVFMCLFNNLTLPRFGIRDVCSV